MPTVTAARLIAVVRVGDRVRFHGDPYPRKWPEFESNGHYDTAVFLDRPYASYIPHAAHMVPHGEWATVVGMATIGNKTYNSRDMRSAYRANLDAIPLLIDGQTQVMYAFSRNLKLEVQSAP